MHCLTRAREVFEGQFYSLVGYVLNNSGTVFRSSSCARNDGETTLGDSRCVFQSPYLMLLARERIINTGVMAEMLAGELGSACLSIQMKL